MAETSVRERIQRIPAPVLDAGLVLAVAAATTVAISVSADRGGRDPWPFGYMLGVALAALLFARRRRPWAVLAASAVALGVYYVSGYPGITPAVPLAAALASAAAAGYVGRATIVVAWFVATPVLWRTLADPEPVSIVLGDTLADAALLGAVLLLGETVRSRRALSSEHRLLEAEREKSERLLKNMLPDSVAERLKETGEVIADGMAEVTVLFADIVDFTRLSERIAPEEVVRTLDELFSLFDRLAERHSLEKIKTIGDAYMLAGGLPQPRSDHAEAVAEMALKMRDEVPRYSDPTGRPLAVRVGIATGPVVAGVIGRKKLSYDLWGDTVNTASRMESHGIPGCIQVTARTHERLRDRYRFQPRGSIHVKGKGDMQTWFLVGRAG
jgi:class 3 adenylate cyclase